MPRYSKPYILSRRVAIASNIGRNNPNYRWYSPYAREEYFSSIDRDQYGVPLPFIRAGGADGADFIGSGGIFPTHFASDTTDNYANIHDYLYTNMGRDDPFFSYDDRLHPDRKLVSDSFWSGHPIDAALIGAGLGLGGLFGITDLHDQNNSNFPEFEFGSG